MAKILVVDDDVQIGRLVQVAFKRSEHEVVTTSEGQDAMRILRSEPIDLVICDVMMPGLNGHEICHLVRLDAELAHIPFLFLSARKEDEDRLEAMEVGSDDFIGKPFSVQELLMRVNRLLMNRSSRRHGIPTNRRPANPLQNIEIAKLTEIIIQKKVSGKLTLNEEDGFIYFRDGQPIAAEFRGLRGAEAAQALRTAAVSSFSFDGDTIADQVVVADSIGSYIKGGGN